MRDGQKPQKLRIIKVIHGIVHWRVFIFYQKPQMFKEIKDLIVSAFNFKNLDDDVQNDYTNWIKIT
jgi:hypothetical protein